MRCLPVAVAYDDHRRHHDLSNRRFRKLDRKTKGEKEMTLKDKPHKVSRYTIYSWKEQKNSSRRNEEAGPQQKQRPVVDVSGGESKLLYCKAQYCIGTEMLGP